MKSSPLYTWRCAAVCWCLGLLLFQSTPAFSQSAPVITAFEAKDGQLTVLVAVPEGVRRVTLEGRSRLDAETWVPLAVRQLDGRTTSVSFTVPHREKFQIVRVRADFIQALPQHFYAGTTNFGGPPTNSTPPGGYWDSVSSGPRTDSNSPERAVRESDIWRVEGDRLYFFNQYRGLQVLDISNPDKASVLGTLPVPAAGEQMYLADDDHVVLLARGGCYSDNESQVMVVGVTNGTPELLTSLPVPGYLLESRMVGSALYVASQTYRQVSSSTNVVWEWGTIISSFDLADAGAPRMQTQLWYPGYGNVVSATDTFLFVVTQNPTDWRQSIVRIVDVTAPDGTMADYTSVTAAGLISDKFKIHYADGVLTTISEVRETAGLSTRLETFRLADPRTVPPVRVAKLATLELGKGERLHATRFDGSKVYIVTFFQIDPLWVVDISDPANPKIAGALEIPGWSTYIKPLGSRLVSVGVETNRVAVSLFDVSEPARPTMLSRVLLGETHSWTEANYDEKAFTILEDANLIMVPYTGYTSNGWASRVQLIDLLPDKLTARGIIEHSFQPRRTAFVHDRVLALSGTELLSVNVADRDAPQVSGELLLAWTVDRVFVKGDYLLQIGNGSSWGWGSSTENASLRLTSQAEPDRPLKTWDLGEFAIAGAELAGDRLYLAQNRNDWSLPQTTNEPNFMLTVLDVGALPELTVVGRTTNSIATEWWATSWQAVWPKPGLIVWSGGGGGSWWRRGPWLDGPVGGGFWPGWYSSGGHLLAYDVSVEQRPALVSEVNLQTNAWYDFSQAFSSGSLVYLSHSQSVHVDPDPGKGWIQQSFLDVLDYEDPANPVLRKPVNIPSKLAGLSHGGELLYTTGVHWSTNQTDWREWVDASAYDGVSAHLVASLELPESWPRPVLFQDGALLLGRNIHDNSGGTQNEYSLEAWLLGEDGKFSRQASLKLPQLVSTMKTKGEILITQDYWMNLQFFDISNVLKPLPIGEATVTGCLWYGIESADGDLRTGLWIPAGLYGLIHVPFSGP